MEARTSLLGRPHGGGRPSSAPARGAAPDRGERRHAPAGVAGRAGLVRAGRRAEPRRTSASHPASRPGTGIGRLAAALALALPAACFASPTAPPREPPVTVDVAVARPPFDAVDVRWKERRPVRYAYREVVGDYRRTPDELRRMWATVRRYALPVDGRPFALFYDDPAVVPKHRLRSRLCFPVAPDTASPGPWEFDVLQAKTVAYTVVAADYGAVPLAYPAIFRHLESQNWIEDGPVREIYLFQPELANRSGPPWVEVQVPWAPAGTATRDP